MTQNITSRRIRALREDAGLTIYELADKLGVQAMAQSGPDFPCIQGEIFPLAT